MKRYVLKDLCAETIRALMHPALWNADNRGYASNLAQTAALRAGFNLQTDDILLLNSPNDEFGARGLWFVYTAAGLEQCEEKNGLPVAPRMPSSVPIGEWWDYGILGVYMDIEKGDGVEFYAGKDKCVARSIGYAPYRIRRIEAPPGTDRRTFEPFLLFTPMKE